MISRIASIMMVATFVVVTTGCSATKNFIFGRGARCGLCTTLGSCLPKPNFGNMMPAPCATGVCGAAPVAAPSYAPAFAPQTLAPAPTCGCPEYAGNPCPDNVYSSGTCGCGNHASEYAPAVNDPYLSSGNLYDNGSIPYEGQIIGQPEYPQALPMNPNPSSVGPPMSGPSDGWQTRKFDSDGNKILWEEPLPSGAKGL